MILSRMISIFITLYALPVAALQCPSGERAFDHAGGTTCIPEKPLRIVSLRDQDITLPLLELGAPIIGSHGRFRSDGSPFMRSVDIHLGINFENSDITFLGDTIDFEIVAELKPDLIIGRASEMEEQDKYDAIAPSVFIIENTDNPLDFTYDLADAAGVLEPWRRLKSAYDANISRVRASMPELDGTTYTKLRVASTGVFLVCPVFGGLTQVLNDLGFEHSAFTQEMIDRGIMSCTQTNIEVLPELDADYIFDSYGLDDGESVFSQVEKLEDLIPSGCQVLPACADGRYVVLPIEVAVERSFSQLNTIIFVVTSHVGRTAISMRN